MHNHLSHLHDNPREIAARYRLRAAATRRHAKRTGGSTSTTLLSLAETYEHIAESTERVEGNRPPTAPSDKLTW
jgi:hypothetical protein